MHVELDISGSRLNYVAGDHLALFAPNDPELVERVGELLGVDLETIFSLTSTDGMETTVPSKLIVRTETESDLSKTHTYTYTHTHTHTHTLAHTHRGSLQEESISLPHLLSHNSLTLCGYHLSPSYQRPEGAG